MLRAVVNGQERALDPEGVETLGEVLDQLQVYFPPSDVVVGVRVNGIDCGSAEPARLRDLPAGGVTEIALETRSPGAFAREARQRVAEYLVHIAAKFERAVEHLRRGGTREALALYGAGAQELGLLVGLWGRLGEIDAAVTAGADGVARDLETICEELSAAQTRNDVAGLQVAVAGRLLPLLARWRAACGAGLAE